MTSVLIAIENQISVAFEDFVSVRFLLRRFSLR
jgi:hypothetical protein